MHSNIYKTKIKLSPRKAALHGIFWALRTPWDIKEENLWSLKDFFPSQSLQARVKPCWSRSVTTSTHTRILCLCGAAESPTAAARASAWLLKPTQVSSLRSKFCFGGQTESSVQTSIFNLDKYPWQLRYYFKLFLFSRLQVESEIEKIPSPPYHPLL